MSILVIKNLDNIEGQQMQNETASLEEKIKTYISNEGMRMQAKVIYIDRVYRLSYCHISCVYD